MRTLLSGFWSLRAGGIDNPIFHYELARWSRLPAWRHSGWLLALVAIGAPMILFGAPMAKVLQYWLFPTHRLSAIALAAVTTLLIGQEIAKQLACLSAAIVTGVAMSTDETQADDLLRLSSLSTRHIVLAKLSAALRPLLLWPALATVARLILLLTTLSGWTNTLFEQRASMNPAWYPFVSTLSPVVGQSMLKPAFWGYGLWQTFAQQIDAIRMTGIWPLWLAYYPLQPLFDFALFTGLGLLAASRTRTRAGGLAAASGLVAVVWVLSYLSERAVAVLVTLLWPLERPFGLFVTPSVWILGLPAMDGSFIVVGGPFETMFLLIIVAKIGLLLCLLRAKRLQLDLAKL